MLNCCSKSRVGTDNFIKDNMPCNVNSYKFLMRSIILDAQNKYRSDGLILSSEVCSEPLILCIATKK